MYFNGSFVKLTKEDIDILQNNGRYRGCAKERCKTKPYQSKLDLSQPNVINVIKILNEIKQENRDHIKKLETDLNNSVENCHQNIEELKVSVQTQAEALNKYEKMYNTFLKKIGSYTCV